MAVDLDAIRASLAGRLPAAYDLANLELVPVTGQASLVEATDADMAALQQQVAAMPVIDTRGRPTLLRIDAWMVHADLANKNGQFFRAADLEAQAASLAREPDFLVMDWNHSAVIPNKDGPRAIGAWYQVSWEHDAAANGGKGAMGLRAQGMMWAWLFPEQANILLGEQARNGYATFSMAALAKEKSFMEDPETGRSVTVLHEPVFFTLSALDVAPADPDARGHVSLAHVEAVTAPVAAQIPEEPRMTPEEKAALEAAHALLTTQVTELQAAQTAADTASSARIAELETSLAEMTSSREALLAEKTDELATLGAALAALTEAHAAVVAELEAFKADRAAAELATVLATRLEALPASFRKAHTARSDADRARMEGKWQAMSQAQWEQYLTDELLFGFEKSSLLSFIERSSLEGGRLPTGGNSEDMVSRAKRLTK